MGQKLEAVHHRHLEIGHHQIHEGRFQNSYGLFAVLRCKDMESVFILGQARPEITQKLLFIVYQEDIIHKAATPFGL